VLDIIVGKVSEGPRTEAGRDLLHVSLTNKTFQAAVAGSQPARHRLLQAPVVPKARELAKQLIGNDALENAERNLCLRALCLLDRQQQAHVVLSGLPDRSLCDREDIKETGIYQAYEQLVPRLAQLDKTLRTELATGATMKMYLANTAMAVSGLGGWLAHLDAPLVDRLVDAATGQPSQEWRSQVSPDHASRYLDPLEHMSDQLRAQAIRGLSVGLGHMKPDQRQRMYNAAMTIVEAQHRGWVFEGLCGEMKYLPEEQQDELFERAMALTDPEHLAHALVGLAKAIDVLKGDRTETVLTKALQLPDGDSEETERKRRVVCALATQVEHLTPTQREVLVARILSVGSWREIAALGPGLGHVDPRQQDQLLETVARLQNSDKAWAIAGSIPYPATHEEPPALPVLAAALPSLAPARRDKLAAIVLGLGREGSASATSDMAFAIGALGPHLEHLQEDRRNALVDQALRVLGGQQVDRLCCIIRTMTSGLGAGLGALREDQRQALVDAVANMPSLLPRSCEDRSYTDSPFTDRLMDCAEAIAGLASGQRHLSTPQFKELIEAADRLKAKYEVADKEWESGDANPERALLADWERALIKRYRLQAMAVAFFGLAAA
jgi:hypothetical protein